MLKVRFMLVLFCGIVGAAHGMDAEKPIRPIRDLPQYLLKDLEYIHPLIERIDKHISQSLGFFEELYQNINQEVDELIHKLYRPHYQKNEARFIKDVKEKIEAYLQKESKLTEQDKNKLLRYVKTERFSFLDFKRQLILYKILEKSIKGTKFFFDRASYGELKELSKIVADPLTTYINLKVRPHFSYFNLGNSLKDVPSSAWFLPSQGWKLHIGFKLSADDNEEQFKTLCKWYYILAKALFHLEVNHKFMIETVTIQEMGTGDLSTEDISQRGKHVTIYPKNSRAAIKTVLILDNLLTKHALNKGKISADKIFQYPPYDLVVGDHKIITARYGQFEMPTKFRKVIIKEGREEILDELTDEWEDRQNKVGRPKFLPLTDFEKVLQPQAVEDYLK